MPLPALVPNQHAQDCSSQRHSKAFHMSQQTHRMKEKVQIRSSTESKKEVQPRPCEWSSKSQNMVQHSSSFKGYFLTSDTLSCLRPHSLWTSQESLLKGNSCPKKGLMPGTCWFNSVSSTWTEAKRLLTSFWRVCQSRGIDSPDALLSRLQMPCCFTERTVLMKITVGSYKTSNKHQWQLWRWCKWKAGS